jgi:hypothetical protein
LVWAAPIVAWIFIAHFPIERPLGAIAWGLSVLVAVTWVVRPVRRLVYHPDAAARGGPSQVAAAALGFAFGVLMKPRRADTDDTDLFGIGTVSRHSSASVSGEA